MTSARLPAALLARLHEATPSGGTIARTIAAALELAGGVDAVARHQRDHEQQLQVRALQRRRRAEGDPASTLEPGQQEALAEAVGIWVRLLEEAGELRIDRPRRRIIMRIRKPPQRRLGEIQLRRREA